MAERVLPVELETGVPLALAPRYDIPRNLKTVPGEHDWHHAVYPKKLYTSVSARALRAARLQYVDYDEHRTYHHYFDEYFANTWQAPKTKLDRFGMVVLLAAGYIPTCAIRSARLGPEYVQLSSRQRELMWQRGLIRPEAETLIFDFLRDVVLSQEIDIEDSSVQEFIFSPDEQLRLRRGNELLVAASECATESIRPQYREAYIGHLIMPQLPPEPRDCILTHPIMLGTEKRLRKARTSLRVSLATTMGVELPDVA